MFHERALRTCLAIFGAILLAAAGPVLAAEIPSLEAQLAKAEAGECTALVLPETTTAEQRLANEQAKERFRELRGPLDFEEQPATCQVSTEALLGGPLQALGMPSNGAISIGAKTCGDCPNCLSAGVCLGCAVGAVCSPPGTPIVRACRVVATCGLIFTTYCCGCS